MGHPRPSLLSSDIFMNKAALVWQLFDNIDITPPIKDPLQVITHNSCFRESAGRTSNFTFNSSRENPLPDLTFMLYFRVWPWTIGLRGPAVGLGKILTAFFCRAEKVLPTSQNIKIHTTIVDNSSWFLFLELQVLSQTD